MSMPEVGTLNVAARILSSHDRCALFHNSAVGGRQPRANLVLIVSGSCRAAARRMLN